MGQIIKPLLRHRLMPLLVVLQVAIACAIACNAIFLLQQKLVPILTPDGVGQPDRLLVVSNVAARTPWSAPRLLATEQALRTIPGVAAVSVSASLPMNSQTTMQGDVYALKSDHKAEAALYIGDHLMATLDLKLVAGRTFGADEQAIHYAGVGMDASGTAIISEALARRLFPDGQALGKVIRVGKEADAGQRTVVGIVANLMRNSVAKGDPASLGNTMLLPGIPGMWPLPNFAVRMNDGADVATVRKAVAATIQRELGDGMVTGITPHIETYSDLRDAALARPRAAVWLLSGVSLIVLIVAMVGIMGLTSYWVAQRTRQIGIRRALGARRRDILRHIQLENLLVVGVGVALGLATAYGINFWLMQHFELARLPWSYLPMGAVLLLVLGQLAVLKPALHASHVPPVVATRSV